MQKIFNLFWGLFCIDLCVKYPAISFQDILAGIGIAAVYLWLGWPFMDMVEEYTMKSTYAPAIIILSHFLLGMLIKQVNVQYCLIFNLVLSVYHQSLLSFI